MSETPNAIAPANTGTIAVKTDDSVFDAISKAGNWLPRIQIGGSNSDAVKHQLLKMGNFGLIKGPDDILDIGPQFNAFVSAWRPKALRLNQDDSMTNIYDVNDPKFAEIQKLSDVQDSGCMFGPEFLLFLEQQKVFATFFFNNKTLRRVSAKLRNLMGGAATLKTNLIENARYSWFGAIIEPCPTKFEIPAVDVVQPVVDGFLNPPANEIDKSGTQERPR